MEFLMYCLLRHLVHVVPMHVNSLCTFVHGVSYHLLLLPLDFMLVLNYLFSRLEYMEYIYIYSSQGEAM